MVSHPPSRDLRVLRATQRSSWGRNVGRGLIVPLVCVMGNLQARAQELEAEERNRERARAQAAEASRAELKPLTMKPHPRTGGGRPLLLQDVLRSVDKHYPVLRIEAQKVEAAEGKRMEARGVFDLKASASGYLAPVGYYDYGYVETKLEQATPFWGISVFGGWRYGQGDIPPYYGYLETLRRGEVKAGIVVPLWRDGRIDSRRTGRRRSDLAWQAAKRAYDAARLKIAVEATSAYWNWVAAGRRYEVIRSLLELAEQRDSQITQQVEAGAEASLTILENRRAILQRRVAIVRSERALQAAALSLSLYLRDSQGRPRNPSTQQLPSEIQVLPALPDLSQDDAIRRALKLRPEIEGYRAEVARAQTEVDLAKNQVAPKLDMTLAASRDLGSGSTDQQTRLNPTVLEGMVNLSMPLQLRSERGKLKSARAELESWRVQAEFFYDQIATQVRDTLSALRAAEAQVEAAVEGAEVARRVAEAERTRFQLGATSLLIVNLREQSAADAEADAIDALANLHVVHARWNAVMGSRRMDSAELPSQSAPADGP